MSAPEGAEAPSEDVDDPEAEDDEPTIPLVAISAATIKRHVALLLERLIKKAADSELFPHKPTAGTNSLRSQEKSDTAAAGSLIGLVHEILLGERWHISGRQVWNMVREMIPQTEEEHWKTGAKTFLINMRVEKRQFAVKDILTELVEKEFVSVLVCLSRDCGSGVTAFKKGLPFKCRLSDLRQRGERGAERAT